MTINFRHFALLGLALPAFAHAEAFQDLDAIDAKAAAVVSEAGLAVSPADRRLKLAACPQPLETEAVYQGAVAVRCRAMGWRIRLPVEGVVRGDNFAPVVIRRGDPVMVEYIASGFSVSAGGVAESNARRGEPVRVRVQKNASSITGEAAGAGQVRVSGFKE